MALTPVPPQTRQYQVWAAPPSIVIAGMTLGMGWFMPLSGPQVPEPGLSAAWTQYTTGFTVPAPVTTDVSVASWLQPFAEPVRVNPSVIDWEWKRNPALLAAGQLTGWQQPFFDPVRVRSSARFDDTWKWVSPIGAGGQAVPMLTPLSEPVRLEPGLGAAWTQYHTGFLVPAPITDVKAFPPLAEPVRVKPRAPWYPPFTISANYAPIIRSDSWHRPFSEPVRAKQNIRWRQELAWSGVTPALAVAIEYWYSGLSEPVKIEPGLGAAWTQYHTGFLVPAPTGVTWGWFNPLSEPTPPEGGLSAAWQQVSTVGTGVAFIEYVYPPFSEPIRVKQGLHASRQQFLAFNPTTPAFTDLRNYWYRPFSEPVRSKKSVPWQQFLTIDWKFTAPAFLSWHRPFGEPVRSKKAVPWQQALAWSQFTPAPPVVVEYWWGALSEPVRVEPGLGAAWTQYHTGFLVPAPVGVTYGWFEPLNEPVQIEQGLGAAHQQVSTVGAASQITQFYYPPFSEPVRVKPSLHRVQFLALNPTTPAAFTDLRNYWYQGLAEPVRSKKAVPWQQFFATDTAQIADLRAYWYRPLSEPVRSKANIRWREPFTTDWQWRAPAPSIGWYQPFSERIRARQSVPWQQPFTTDWKWTPPAGQVFAGWYEWLGEPVRQKQGLHAARQQFFTTDWKWTAPAFLSWHQWFREPVRQKPGLHASRQQFFTMDWKWDAPPQLLINYTLNATEQGDYGRLFYTSMDICVGAYVTITEEEVGNMAVVVITERSE